MACSPGNGKRTQAHKPGEPRSSASVRELHRYETGNRDPEAGFPREAAGEDNLRSEPMLNDQHSDLEAAGELSGKGYERAGLLNAALMGRAPLCNHR